MSVGDWGSANPTTTDLAQIMELAYRDPSSVGCSSIDFIVALGDNFYNVGVSGVDDEQWNTTFVSQFRRGSLEKALYYPVLGNHDYMDDGSHPPNRSQGLNQVAYHYERDALWYLPAANHTFTRLFNMTDGGLLLKIAYVVIDSECVHLCANGSPSCWDPQHADWVNETLTILDADQSVDHIVVLMHHALASPVGGHPDPKYDAALIPIMRSHRVSFTLAGHAHFVSWAKEDDLTSQASLSLYNGGELWYITNGAARGAEAYSCSWEGESILTNAVLSDEVCLPAEVNSAGAFMLHRVQRTFVEHVVFTSTGANASSVNTAYRQESHPQLPASWPRNDHQVAIIASVAALIGLGVLGLVITAVLRSQRAARRGSCGYDYVGFEQTTPPT